MYDFHSENEKTNNINKSKQNVHIQQTEAII